MRRLLLLAAVLTLGACGSQPSVTITAGSTINGGVIPVSQAATYTFSLTGPCPNTEFRMLADIGTTEYLNAGPSSGQIYLAAGNWSSSYGFFEGSSTSRVWSPAPQCPWQLTLTAQSP